MPLKLHTKMSDLEGFHILLEGRGTKKILTRNQLAKLLMDHSKMVHRLAELGERIE